MRAILIPLSILSTILLVAATTPDASKGDWSMNASIIEACSCPMFCQCFFNTEPAYHGESGHEGHHGGRYCLGNIAYQVNKGSYNGTRLDGVKFWLAGDLGSDFSKGEAEWGIVTFDPTVTPKQREGVLAILPKVYPLKWKSFVVGKDAPIEWNATKETATARLDGGKGAEVILNRFAGMTNEPVVIKNLRYIGAPRNEGFALMPNQVESWKGDKAFEYRGTNGFLVTIDINSRDAM